MTRPRSIAQFEMLYLLAVAIEVLRIASQLPLLMKAEGTGLWERVVAVGLSLLLLLLASRLRQRIAGLLLTALFIVGLPMLAYVFAVGMTAIEAVSLVIQLALQVAALALFFTPKSRAWFAAPAT